MERDEISATTRSYANGFIRWETLPGTARRPPGQDRWDMNANRIKQFGAIWGGIESCLGHVSRSRSR